MPSLVFRLSFLLHMSESNEGALKYGPNILASHMVIILVELGDCQVSIRNTVPEVLQHVCLKMQSAKLFLQGAVSPSVNFCQNKI